MIFLRCAISKIDHLEELVVEEYVNYHEYQLPELEEEEGVAELLEQYTGGVLEQLLKALPEEV